MKLYKKTEPLIKLCLCLFMTFTACLTSYSQTTSLRYGTPFDLLEVTPIETVSFSDLETERRFQDVVFNPTGDRLYLDSRIQGMILQYEVSVPFELSSEVTLVGGLDISDSTTTAGGFTFSADGTRFYIINIGSNAIISQYELSQPYDLTSTVVSKQNVDFGTDPSFSEGIQFNDTGDLLFLLSTEADIIYTYSLSEPFDVSSSTQLINEFDNSSNSLSACFNFNNDGTKLFIGNAGGRGEIDQYALTQAYDLSTATLSGEYSLDNSSIFPTGITFDAQGNKFFISDNGRVLQYVTGGGFVENGSNTGFVDGQAVITLEGDGAFSVSNQELTFNTDYEITNLPDGLDPVLFVAQDGRSADLRFQQQAVDREDIDDVSDIIINFLPSAFNGNVAMPVGNAENASTGFSIDFRDNNAPTIVNPLSDLTLTSGFSLRVVQLSGVFTDIDAQSISYDASSDNPAIATASIDDNQLILSETSVGSTTINVTATDEEGGSVTTSFNVIISNPFLTYQEPFNILNNLPIASGKLDVENDINNAKAIAFDAFGMMLFVLEANNTENVVHQYSLSTPYDLNSIVDLVADFALDPDINATDIGFNNNGDRLFVSVRDDVSMLQYDLSTPFDLTSTITPAGSFFLQSLELNLESMTFNNDGSRVIVAPINGIAIEYELTVPFDISSSLSEVGSLDLTSEVSPVQSIRLSEDGQFLFAIDRSEVVRYTLENDFTITAGAVFGDSFLLFAQGFIAQFFELSRDGSRFFSGGSDIIRQFDLPQAYGLGQDAIELENSWVFEEDFDNEPGAIGFSNDGLKAFVHSSSRLFQFSLTVPYDLAGDRKRDTAVFIGNIEDFSFNTDGTKIFTTGSNTSQVNNFITEYSVAEPYDITAGVTNITAFSFALNLNIPTAHAFSADGSRLFVADIQTNTISQYALNTPFDLSDGVTFQLSKAVSSGSVSGMAFNAEGTRLTLIDGRNNGILQQKLSEPFDLNGIFSFVGYINLNFDDTFQKDISFNNTGSRLYVSLLRDGLINQYHIGGGFDEIVSDTGETTGMSSISLNGASFAKENGLLEDGVDYTVNNLPDGLTPNIMVLPGAKRVVLSLQGTATNSADTDDVNNLSVTFTNTAFTDISASDVDQSTFTGSGFSVDFFDFVPLPEPEPDPEPEVVSLEPTIEQSLFKTYPNPVTDQITFEVSEEVSDSIIDLVVMSLEGKPVLSKQISTTSGNIKLNLSSLRSGVYILLVNQKSHSQQIKIIKE